MRQEVNVDKEPPDCGGGGGLGDGGGLGGPGGSQGGPGGEHRETGARSKTTNGMRGATPATSSPSEDSPNGVSVDSQTSITEKEAADNLSKKVSDLRDPRNLPALGNGLNFARAVSKNGASNEKPKSFELTLELVSFDKSRNYSMNHDELAKLLFEKVRIPSGDCILGYDANEQQYIRLEIDSKVDVKSLNLTDGFSIREGLRLNPIRPVLNDTLIKLFWTPMGMDHEEIRNTLSLLVR